MDATITTDQYHYHQRIDFCRRRIGGLKGDPYSRFHSHRGGHEAHSHYPALPGFDRPDAVIGQPVDGDWEPSL